MVARIRLLQLAVGIVNLSIVALAFTSIWPFPSGQFKVNLPSTENDVDWSVTDGIVHVSAPFSVENYGYYDVKDLVVSYSVTNDTLFLLAGDNITVGDIPAGQVTSSSIDFQFDLLNLLDAGVWMLFHDNLLRFHIEVSCLYTMELVVFEATYQAQIFWDALIKSFGVMDITYQSTPPAPGDPISVTVDYWLHTSSRLAGLPGATVVARFYGDGVLIGNGSGAVRLGDNYTDSLVMSVDPQLSSEYSIVLELHVAGFTFYRTFVAPSLSGLIP